MTTTVFVNETTLTDADWFNDVDALVYEGVFPAVTPLTIGGNIVVSGNGPHAIGTTADTRYGLFVNLDHAQVGGTSTALMRIAGLSTPEAGDPAYGLTLFGVSFQTAASGTHSNFATLDISPPTILAGAGTVARSATVYVSGAPTGAVENLAFMVGSGSSRFDGIIQGPNSVDRLDLDSSSSGRIDLRAVGDMYFRMDADSNESDKSFFWEHDSGSNLMTLDESGLLTLTGYVVLDITDTDATVEGSVWYDASEDKLKFKTAAGVETITSS